MTRKLHLSFLLFFLTKIYASLSQNILESGASPSTIHNSAIKPVYALHFLDGSSHGMATISGALEGADHGVLIERLKIYNGKTEAVFDCTLNSNPMSRCIDKRNGAVGSEPRCATSEDCRLTHDSYRNQCPR